MTEHNAGKPTISTLRARARDCSIEISPEREGAIMAGVEHLHAAAGRLDRIAVDDDANAEGQRA